MGWFHEDVTGHEGYLLGLVRDGEWRWRELGTRKDRERAEAARSRVVEVEMVQLACECGWRSQRLVPPLGIHWIPSIISFRHDDGLWRDAASEIWRQQHIKFIRDKSPATEGVGGSELLLDVGRRLHDRVIRYSCANCDNAGEMRRGELPRECWCLHGGKRCGGHLRWEYAEIAMAAGNQAVPS